MTKYYGSSSLDSMGLYKFVVSNQIDAANKASDVLDENRCIECINDSR